MEDIGSGLMNMNFLTVIGMRLEQAGYEGGNGYV
jgi:hypothetical protein